MTVEQISAASRDTKPELWFGLVSTSAEVEISGWSNCSDEQGGQIIFSDPTKPLAKIAFLKTSPFFAIKNNQKHQILTKRQEKTNFTSYQNKIKPLGL